MRRIVKRGLVGCAAVMVVGLAGCGGDPGDGGDPAATSAAAAPATAQAVKAEPSRKHQPNEAQVSMYVRRLNIILAKTGESMTLEDAMPLAASVCEFIEMGNSPYDAAQVLEKSGVPEDAAAEIVPLAMGAACNDKLPPG
ncbi:hypothetical protein O4215_20765 [Rhodococcus maanshanensis]|uniref:DUF732 domain-containing protein n=1 Tax=Rhodococcus maanshanensis TaxID=183556 RepID=UPI0022B36B36|nr:hypothetical protein [Rhodococcus maanshanensis]MCZ4557998.1 hypothetical protein [Rhodococcus maanshanensis]